MNKQAVSLMKYYATVLGEEPCELNVFLTPMIGGNCQFICSDANVRSWNSSTQTYVDGSVTVTSTEPMQVKLWQINNPTDTAVQFLAREIFIDKKARVPARHPWKLVGYYSASSAYVNLLGTNWPLAVWRDTFYNNKWKTFEGFTWADRMENGSDRLQNRYNPSFGRRLDYATYNGVLRVSAEATEWNQVPYNCGYGGALFADGVVSTIKCTSGAFGPITDIWWPYNEAPANLGLSSRTIVHLNHDGSRPYFHYRGGIQPTSDIPTPQRQEELRFFDAPLWDRFSDYGTYSPVYFSSWSSPETGLTTWKDRKCLHIPQGKSVSWRRVNEDFFPQWKDVRADGGRWSNVTLSCWVCPTQSDNTWRSFCLFGIGGMVKFQALRFGSSGKSFYGGFHTLDIQKEFSTADEFKQWHHLALTRQGKDSSVYTFYVDGVKIGNSTQTTNDSTRWLRQNNDCTTVSLPDTSLFADYYISDVEVRGYAMDLAGVQNRLAETKYQDQVLTEIPDEAFKGLSELDWTELPSNFRNVTRIGDSAFYGCTNLALSEIPSTVTSIGSGAFADCANVTFSSLPSWMIVIPENLFRNCSKITISQLPPGCTELKNTCFGGSSITLTEIPNTITTIGDEAFAGCKNVTATELPSSVTSIGEGSFISSGVRFSTLPAGITTIPVYALARCQDLQIEEIPSTVTALKEGALAYSNMPLKRLPDNGISIELQAFQHCKNLQLTEIPVTAVIEDTADGQGAWLFQGCTSLTTMNIKSPITMVGYGMFYGCSNLETVILPSTVTRIRRNAFSGSKLTSITLDSSAVTVDEYAFQNLSALTTFTTSATCALALNRYAFISCTSLAMTSLPEGTTLLEEGVFAGCKSLKLTTFPASVTSIPNRCFLNCTGLETLILPATLTSISPAAFSGCTGLTSLRIEGATAVINAFISCTALTTIDIIGTATLASNAFYNCTALTVVKFYSILTTNELAPTAFSGCTALADIYVPWSEGAVANAPWGAENATIHYDWVPPQN